MQVVILCGGRGTWIRDVSENIFKPIFPINDPILPLPLALITVAKLS